MESARILFIMTRMEGKMEVVLRLVMVLVGGMVVGRWGVLLGALVGRKGVKKVLEVLRLTGFDLVPRE